MKTVYINLESDTEKNHYMKTLFPRAERINAVSGREETEESILPFSAEESWRDPYHNRRLTSGEIGCFLSHWNVWNKCIQEGEDFLILEDDVGIINPSYQQALESAIKTFPEQDLVYLSSKPMSSYRESLTDLIETAGYSYWTSGYYLSVDGAKKLKSAAEKTHKIIPVDEFIPACMGNHPQKEYNDIYSDTGLKGIRFKHNLIEPRGGESSTENSPIWSSIKLSIVTVATDPSKAQDLIKSSLCPIINLGEGVEWKGGSMKGPGGGQKVNLFRNYLNSPELMEDQVILFLDGYDTSIFATPRDLVERYLDFKKEVVFAAELSCWPDVDLAPKFLPPENGHRYLNSGCIIGTVRELRKILSEPIQDPDDDQLYYQRRYLTGDFDVCLDHEGWLFSCLSGVEDQVVFQEGLLHNFSTNCTSLVLHGNGGGTAKQRFDQLVDENPYISSFKVTSIEKTDVRYLDRDIIVIDNFLPKEYCDALIQEADSQDWKPLDKDAYPGQEVRLRNLNNKEFKKLFYKAYREKIVPIVQEHWAPMKMFDIRDLFVIKYSMDGQRSLPLHHDMSLVSGSLKLNDDYEGAELVFPRQGVSNKDLPVGSIVLWPSAVTHPHKCEDLVSGTKYSLTMWTGKEHEDKEPN